MRKILVLILFSLFYSYSNACNNSSFTIVSQTTNPDGSITYVLDLNVELGGFDSFWGFTLSFNSPTNTPTVMNFDPSITSGDLSSGNTDPLTGLTGSDINSVAGDSDWNSYDNKTNVLSYEGGGFINPASNDFSLTTSVTVMGCAETIEFNASVNSGSAQCIYTSATGQNCASCSITAVTAGNQSVCNPATNTYTQEVVITYTNPPGAGTLDVNGQSFAITSSPQTVTLTGLTADGNNVNVVADFSADATCLFNANSLFTAPVACTVTCSISIAAGNQTACVPATGLYTQEVIVTYANEPGSGTIDVNGQSFAITTSPQTVTLTGLTADGNNVNVSADFSADGACAVTTSNLFTAPVACPACPADIGTVGVVGGTLIAANEYDVCRDSTIVLTGIGYTLQNSANPDFAFAVLSCAPTTADPRADPCFLGWDLGAVSTTENIGGYPGNTFYVVPVTLDNLGNTTATDFDGDGCFSIGNTITINFLNTTCVVPCATACGDCTTPNCTIGSVAEFPDRTYLSCNSICMELNDVTYVTYHTVTTDAYGNIGVVQVININQALCSGITRTAVLRTTANSCGGPDLSPDATNANGVGSGFNPEWYGLTPNTTYTLIVTTVIGSNCSYDSGCIDYYGVPCTISVAAGNQTACVPATGQYTQEVVVTYTNEPASGTLDVNGQSFAITSSPQTVILTGLTADGNNVNVTAEFSDAGACTVTTNNLFTAPVACNPCTISVVAGNQTACVPATGQYTQEVIVTYANEPGSGTIDVNGQSFAITTSPQSVVLTNLTADGNGVDVTALFSASAGCSVTTNNLFTAPVACNVCGADAGTISK